SFVLLEPNGLAMEVSRAEMGADPSAYLVRLATDQFGANNSSSVDPDGSVEFRSVHRLFLCRSFCLEPRAKFHPGVVRIAPGIDFLSLDRVGSALRRPGTNASLPGNKQLAALCP